MLGCPHPSQLDQPSTSDCIRSLSPGMFELFTTFVLHVDVMCFQTAQLEFQSRADRAARMLLESAQEAETRMQRMGDGLRSMADEQSNLVRSQSVVLKSLQETYRSMRVHQQNLKGSIESVSRSIDAAFDRVTSKLSVINTSLDMVVSFEALLTSYAGVASTLAWHGVLGAVFWVLTMERGLSGARLPVLGTQAIAVAVERGLWMLCTPSTAGCTLWGVCRVETTVTWFRTLEAACCVLWVVRAGWFSVDPMEVSLSKLSSIEQLLQEPPMDSPSVDPLTPPDSDDPKPRARSRRRQGSASRVV
jgi:hypothetical protein